MLHKDEWLSQYFKGGAYAYHYTKPVSVNLPVGFVYAKLPAENQAELTELMQGGFKLAEVSVVFEQKKLLDAIAKPTHPVGFVNSTEKQAVIDIAKNAFVFSRFYQDRCISQETASQIKSDWVANYFNGKRGDNLIVARSNDRVIGFLLLIKKTTIDLIAVAEDYYRQGIASTMIAFANQTVGLLTAGTQLNNRHSIALYEKCGFCMKNSYFVLHQF